jgi:hypothetical protein
MSKRQGGRQKAANDFYPTPASAVLPLIPFLRYRLRYFEPCAGAGDLINHLAAHTKFCVGACDIEPRGDFIARRSCLDLTEDDLANVGAFVTNPPHTHEWLAPIIEHLRKLRPTWLLLPLDWFATVQAAPHLRYCSHIVVIGRMKIYPGSDSTGFDNFVWARFEDYLGSPSETIFHGR